MTYRILLAYPGGEVTLHRYKKPMPIHDVTRKAADLASGLFRSWYWGDGEIPAIIEMNSNAMILIVSGPSHIDCSL
jgi:hypothetical protein